MLYAILYDDCEDVLESWTPEREAGAISKLNGVADDLSREGRLGAVARMMLTTTATTLRHCKQPIIVDGPFTQTKEQLLGFVVACVSLEQAIGAASDLGQARSASGSHEIRPLRLLRPEAPRR